MQREAGTGLVVSPKLRVSRIKKSARGGEGVGSVSPAPSILEGENVRRHDSKES